MSEFGGLRKHENNQHARVPSKKECGCPSGGGIENGHIATPPMEERRKKERKKVTRTVVECQHSTPKTLGSIPWRGRKSNGFYYLGVGVGEVGWGDGVVAQLVEDRLDIERPEDRTPAGAQENV